VLKTFGLITNIIGEGGYGKVYKTKKDFALKKTQTSFETLKEFALMDFYHHPNIMCISGIYSEFYSHAYFAALPLANGTMASIWDELKKDSSLRLKAFQQIFLALAYIHSSFVIHGDIKPANILVFIQKGWLRDIFTFKIADFGLAITHTYVPVKHSTNIVTLVYKAPELFSENVAFLSRKLDIWSMGIIMYDIIFQKTPKTSIYAGGLQFTNKPEENLQIVKYNIMNKLIMRTDFKTNFVPQEENLARKCLNIDVANRPYAIECLKHPLLQSLSTSKDLYAVQSNKLSKPPTKPYKSYANRKYVVQKSKLTINNEFPLMKYEINVCVLFYMVLLLDSYFQIVDIIDMTESKINKIIKYCMIIAVYFIDNLSFKSEYLIQLYDKAFENLLKTLDYQIYYGTAIQMFTFERNKFPNKEEFKELVQLLENSPNQNTFTGISP